MKKKVAPKKTLKVGDVRESMKQLGLSPEELSRIVPISNMTIRRLLQTEDRTAVPSKYVAHFEKAFTTVDSPMTFAKDAKDMDALAIHLMELSKKADSPQQLKTDLDKKMRGEKFDSGFVETVNALRKWALQKENLSYRLIAIGALIYFIMPVDLVPDYLFPMGYLDDLGVMTLALMKIRSLK